MKSKTWYKNYDKFLKEYYYQDCLGCPEGHSSFWRTIIMSDEWKLWQKEQSRRMSLLCKNKLPKKLGVYDMPECEEGGIMSLGHWKDFIKFLNKK